MAQFQNHNNDDDLYDALEITSEAAPKANAVPAKTKKRLIVCCDGTFNDSVGSSEPLTNVSRLSRCIEDFDKTGTPQIVYYHAGLGTTAGSWLSKRVDAATGRGIDYNIRNAYMFISLNYNPGDDIFLVGFSRGAYTARCIASFISDVGILTKPGLMHLDTLFDVWHERADKGNVLTKQDQILEAKTGIDKYSRTLMYLTALGHLHKGRAIIQACALWDTVAALGIPSLFGLPTLSNDKLTFVDKDLPPCVLNAFHAMALNERRHDYKPVLFVENKYKRNIKQCWFMGAHSDVGGGYPDIGLSNITLIWMVSQLRTFTDLEISDKRLGELLVPQDLNQIVNDQLTVRKGMNFLPEESYWFSRFKGLPNLATGKVSNSRTGIFLLNGTLARSAGLSQTIHFSVRLMMARRLAECPVLKDCATVPMPEPAIEYPDNHSSSSSTDATDPPPHECCSSPKLMWQKPPSTPQPWSSYLRSWLPWPKSTTHPTPELEDLSLEAPFTSAERALYQLWLNRRAQDLSYQRNQRVRKVWIRPVTTMRSEAGEKMVITGGVAQEVEVEIPASAAAAASGGAIVEFLGHALREAERPEMMYNAKT